MKIMKVKNADFDRAAAQYIVRAVLKKPDAVLCLATGDTTRKIFDEIVRLKQELDIDFSKVHVLNLDEYVGVSPEDPASCRWRIVDHLHSRLGLREDQYYIPDAEDMDGERACEEFRRVLAELGGVDLLLLSVWQNGHIAFNEPGTSFGLGIHLAPISDSTKEAKKELFGGKDRVPELGISVGIADVMNMREILFAAKGPHKADIVEKALRGPVTEEVPASVLQLHPNLCVILDEDAAAKL